MPVLSRVDHFGMAISAAARILDEPLKWNTRSLAADLKISEKTMLSLFKTVERAYGLRVEYDRREHGLMFPNPLADAAAVVRRQHLAHGICY